MSKAYFVRQKVRQFIAREDLASQGQRILLAVSGGPDSMAMLHIMAALREELGLELSVAHLNHGLRPEAGTEEAFVGEQAAALGMPFFRRSVDIRERAIRQGISWEEAGRLARYEFFDQLALSSGFARIATGHHQGDVAETVLHHLLRGSGMRGLQGILPRRGTLIRPLLELDKRDLQAYLDELQIPFCQDSSNDEDHFTRNHIRNRLIPCLQAHYNPSIVGSLNQTARIIREESAFLNETMLSLWPDLLGQESDSRLALKAAALAGLPLAMRRRAVLHALEIIGGREKWTMNDVEAVLGLLDKTGSRKALDLKSGLTARKDYERLVIARRPEPVPAYSYPVVTPGSVLVRETGRCYDFSLHDAPDYRPEPGDFVLDYERLGVRLQLRSRRPGDRFVPAGMSGHKKVKDFYIDARISYDERERTAVLASPEGRVWALVGLRADAAVQPDTDSRRLLVIRHRQQNFTEV